jgi:RimJ/RimL family protein N-acetyltransferase
MRYTFAVVLSATDDVLGAVELDKVNVISREAELTMWLAREARGHGYGREAAYQVLGWATSTLQFDVGGLCEPDNEASIALMQSLGMEDRGQTTARSKRLGEVPVRHFVARRRT